MNPFGVFATTANQAQNGFYNPTSVSHMQPGWGVDPSLLTPSYDAPYRPRFQGPSPYSAYSNPTMMGAASQLMNPFARDPYWGTPTDHTRGAVDSLSQKPFDSAMEVGQRFVAPAIAYGLAAKIAMGSKVSGLWTGGGLGGAAGKSFGIGMARGLGMGSGAAGIAGGAGSMIFGGIATMGIGAVAMAGAETIFQGYSRQRQIGNDLQNNFKNFTFSDATGHQITGRGLGRSESASMSHQIDRAGIQDMTWSSAQYGAIADMSSKAGLLDSTGSSKQLVDKFKGISEQIKLIVAISKDPSIQGAIEELSKLKMGGASINGGVTSSAASSYRQLGNYASMAGTSVQKLMATVGTQGQYMFQMNGMTPYLGQMAAGNAYAGFSAAHRTGVIGDAQLARMGGAEGATQSVLSAQLSSLQTPYNKMRMANKYLGGGAGGGVVDNLTRFGNNAAKNPVRAQGEMMLYGKAMASRASREDGNLDPERQALEMMEAAGLIKPGEKVDPADMVAVMVGNGMMSETEAVAYVASRSGENDPATAALKSKAIAAQTSEQTRSFISQNNLGTGAISTVSREVTNVGKAFKSVGSAMASPVVDAVGWTGDRMENIADFLTTGSAVSSERRQKYRDVLGTTSGNLYKNLEGEVQKGSGLRGELVDNLDVMGDADELMSFYTANPEKSMIADIRKKLEEPKYRDLKKAMGDIPVDQMVTRIRELSNYGKSSGMLGVASLISGSDANVDQVMANPGKHISDPKVVKQIQEAKGDRAKISKIIATHFAKMNGGTLVGESVNLTSDMSDEQAAAAGAIIKDGAKAQKQVYDSANSRVDYSKFTSATKMLDGSSVKLNEAAGNLNDAAKAISKAAAGSEGSSTYDKTKSGLNAWKNFLG